MADTDMMCPPDHTGLALDILDHLHTRGVVRNPNGDQRDPTPGEQGLPACFFGGWDDEPDHAVTIIGPYNASTETDLSPRLEFTVGVRTDPWDGAQLMHTAQAVRTALTIRQTTALTAHQSVLYCERIRVDAPVRDDNNRWILAATYQLRPTTQPN